MPDEPRWKPRPFVSTALATAAGNILSIAVLYILAVISGVVSAHRGAVIVAAVIVAAGLVLFLSSFVLITRSLIRANRPTGGEMAEFQMIGCAMTVLLLLVVLLLAGFVYGVVELIVHLA